MSNKKERKEKRVSKKIVFISLILICILIAAVSVFLFLLGERQSEEKEGEEKEIYYHPANFDEDIFENGVYLSLNRDLIFGTGYFATAVPDTEEGRKNASEECTFFLDYFHALKYGEYESFPHFFADGFFKAEPKFTMQMLYDLQVTYHSSTTDSENGEDLQLSNYLVSYKIYQNNGTFRKGIPSNVASPQIYQLMKNADGEYKIYRILEIENEA